MTTISPSQDRPKSESIKYRLRKTSAFPLLALIAGLSFLMLLLPGVDSLAAKIIFLLPPLIAVMMVTLVNPRGGLLLWSLGLTVLVTQTGFQADIGPVRLSALELAIPTLLLILVYFQRSARIENLISKNPPGQTLMLVFTICAFAMLLIGLINGSRPEHAVTQFKGFLLYPFMAYILLAGIRDLATLRWCFAIPVIWFSYTSVASINRFAIFSGGGEHLYRAGDIYAPENLFGITMTATALLLLGPVLYTPRVRNRVLGAGIVLILFLGGVSAVSRTTWVMLAGALIFLFWLGNGNRKFVLLAALAAIVIWFFLPEVVTDRIWQLSDSSTERRSFYLESGWQAWLARPLNGWGWGKAFWYYPGQGLVASGGIPWYHNDYLNLAVQTGLIGLLLYLGYWGTQIKFALRWLNSHPEAELAGYIVGSLTALVSVLIAGGFEHVLWRPDIAGLLGLFSGLLWASLSIGTEIEARKALPVQ